MCNLAKHAYVSVDRLVPCRTTIGTLLVSKTTFNTRRGLNGNVWNIMPYSTKIHVPKWCHPSIWQKSDMLQLVQAWSTAMPFPAMIAIQLMGSAGSISKSYYLIQFLFYYFVCSLTLLIWLWHYDFHRWFYNIHTIFSYYFFCTKRTIFLFFHLSHFYSFYYFT